MKEKKYYKFISIAKGIGIFLVVLGHCASDKVEKFVLLFHMPLFFFISGYLFNLKSLDNPRKYIKKKIKSLYLPYLCYELIFLLLNNFFININFYNLNKTISGKTVLYLNFKDIIKRAIKIVLFMGREPIGGALWFLVVLFFVTILFFEINLLLKKIQKDQNEETRFFIFFILFIIGNLLTKFGLTIPRFNNTLVMLFIYYLGFLVKQYLNNIKFDNFTIFKCSVILLLTNYIYGSISVNTNTYLSPDFLIVNMVIGVYIVFYISKRIENIKIGKLFEILGNNSLEIMALHFLAFKITTFFIMKIFNLSKDVLSDYPTIIPIHNNFVIIYLLFGLGLPLSFSIIFKKIKNKIMNKFGNFRT